MAKKKKNKKLSTSQKIKADTCRHIKAALDQINGDIFDAVMSGRDKEVMELIYLESRFKDLADRLNCSGKAIKSKSGKALVKRLLKDINKAKK